MIKSLTGLVKYLELEQIKSIGHIHDFKISEELLPHVDSNGLNYVSKISIQVTPLTMAKYITVSIRFVTDK